MGIVERARYEAGTDGRPIPVEPLRLTIDMRETPAAPGMSVEMVVPSRTFTEYSMDEHYPRSQEESQPPHARIRVGKDVDVSSAFKDAELSLAVADKSLKADNDQFEPHVKSLLATTKMLFGVLGVAGLPVNKDGTRGGKVELTPEMMNAATAWTRNYFSSHTFQT
jgi:hypothetical protein